jgi:hypothetical protein
VDLEVILISEHVITVACLTFLWWGWRSVIPSAPSTKTDQSELIKFGPPIIFDIFVSIF